MLSKDMRCSSILEVALEKQREREAFHGTLKPYKYIVLSRDNVPMIAENSLLFCFVLF